MRLLLAEDEKELSNALVTILKHNNYSVDAVYDGLEALDYLKAENYDGAILDIMMPKMDGLQAAKAIRAMQAERPDAEEIPIIALTADAFAEDVQKCFETGMNGHIAKPIEPERLYAALQSAVTAR